MTRIHMGMLALPFWLLTACDGGTQQEACADIAIADCANTEGCAVLRARRLADDGAGGFCYDSEAAFEDIECSGDTSCDSAEEIAEDETGQQWLFPSSCLAEGFTSVGSYAPDCPAE